MSKWQEYSDKFSALTPREQYIIFGAAMVLTVYMMFTLVIEGNLISIKRDKAKVVTVSASNQTAERTIVMYEDTLKDDPNTAIKEQISRAKAALAEVDKELLTLTSELINPIQMRTALVDILSLESGVSLVAFEVLAPNIIYANAPVTGEQRVEQEKAESQLSTPTVGLYQHGIKLKLKGSYGALQAYLQRLEQLKWKFFWQQFELNVIEYPNNELSVTLYSLSTQREFLGV
ncbi:MAG: hypothetical protein MK214_15540 [Thalassotalea sp.]|nr:hypothetical protein [Thalassotalea sp.]